MDKPASIVIPNYNGKHLLEENLPYTYWAAKRYSPQTEIIVVDDASSDNSKTYLEKDFPDVRVVPIDTNVGFARACEEGIKAAQYDVVILLNTDVRVKEDFLAPLVCHFSDDRVFAVSAMSLREDRATPRELAKVPVFKRGYLKFVSAENPHLVRAVANGRCSHPIHTFYAVGAHCAIDKQKYYSLGGFDHLYYPFYWEDVDLCYRAWKRGWKSIFEPRSVVYHTLSGPIHSENHFTYKANIIRRNRFLFIWKNLTSTRFLLLHHVVPVLFRSLFGVFVLDVNYYRALFTALSRLDLARSHRLSEKLEGLGFSDAEIFDMTSEILSNGSQTKISTEKKRA